MSHGKEFTLYTHTVGPNGWKVAIMLEELGFTYESIYLDFQKGEQKGPDHVKLNPNGRIPTLIDHKNNNFVMWESDAILLYLAQKYDPEHKISAATEIDKFKELQWLFFQASGQGPYFGQLAWFSWFHHEKLPSAVERYTKEIKRVWGVLDGILAKQEWLIGDGPTISDFSFITWNQIAVKLLSTPEEPYSIAKEFPAVGAWQSKLEARPSAKKIAEVKASFA